MNWCATSILVMLPVLLTGLAHHCEGPPLRRYLLSAGFGKIAHCYVYDTLLLFMGVCFDRIYFLFLLGSLFFL